MDDGTYRKLTEDLAIRVHDILRTTGTKPHIRVTKDEAWIRRHGTNSVDTHATDYFDLPSDWQNERRVGAEIALDAVLEAIRNGDNLDHDFVEKTSEKLHIQWLNRNARRATNEQGLEYKNLTEEEKEKDRAFVRAALEIYKQNPIVPPQP